MTDRFDSFQELIESITPEIHSNLKSAVETGRWPNGDRLTPAQLEHSLQAIIAYEALHVREEDRVGYIDRSGLQQSHCETPNHRHEVASLDSATITWVDSGLHGKH